MSHVIGVDLGGTKTAAALVDVHGQVRPVLSVPTPAMAGPEAVLDAVGNLVRDVLADANLAPAHLSAVGIGTAGVVDSRTGIILSATDALPGWTGTDVGQGVRVRLTTSRGSTLHVTVENDVDAHAAGEAWLGAAAGVSSALMVAVGTGVGGAVVFDGVPLRGARSLAGEMGHMPAPGADGLRCGCGRLGHLEALGSGPALHRHFLTLGGDPTSPDTRDVVGRALEGDVIALRAVRDSATIVGRATAGLVTVLDPDVVVLGGGMADAGPLWWDAMETALRAELIEPFASLPVVPAKLGATAAILGAAHRAWTELPAANSTTPSEN